ncbi:MAG: Lrp/AsnC ligand binding domain-containing protein [Candidatus Thermoplasmatota archaeon]
MWGFVLASVATGKETEFFSNLGTIAQVRRVFYLFEEYDYLLEIEAGSPEEIATVITNGIRRLPGVVRTASFIESTAHRLRPVEREAFSIPEPKTVW